jgi:hypothetical protein
MARELKNIRVRLISLVKEGANRKSLIYKGSEMTEVAVIRLTKNDPELGVAYGIVYAPDEIDAQGDSASAEEIRKAAYEFIRWNSADAVDMHHDGRLRNDAFICESWIVKTGDPFFSETGAWAVGVRLESEELRNAVKSGEIGALSMYGEASINKSSDEVNKGLLNAIKSAIKSVFREADLNNLNLNKGKEQEMDENQVATLVKSALDTALSEINAKLEPIGERLTAIEAELSKSKQESTPRKPDEKPSFMGVL